MLLCSIVREVQMGPRDSKKEGEGRKVWRTLMQYSRPLKMLSIGLGEAFEKAPEGLLGNYKRSLDQI